MAQHLGANANESLTTLEPTSGWSAALQAETRAMLVQLPVTPDGKLHFKHDTQRYAFAACNEVSLGRLILHSKASGSNGNDGGERPWFDDVAALVQAGWVVD